MAKRGIIIGGGLVVLLGIGCLGLSTVASVGAWFVLGSESAVDERTYSEFGDHSGPALQAEPEAVLPADSLELVVGDMDTEMDTEADSEADTEAVVVEAAVTGSGSTSSTRTSSTRRTRPAPAPAPRPFSAPGEVEAPVPEEENLDDIDLERTAIEIIDEELTPRELRRLRRREGRD